MQSYIAQKLGTHFNFVLGTTTFSEKLSTKQLSVEKGGSYLEN